MKLSTFEVTHRDGADTMQPRSVVAPSRGSARMSVLRDLRDAWGTESATFADLRVRRIGPPVSSAQLVRVAAYRGVPHARAGDLLDVFGQQAQLADADDSANFVVLFLTGPRRGQRGSVHVRDLHWQDRAPAAVAAADCEGSQVA